jgi:hypothetical protein
MRQIPGFVWDAKAERYFRAQRLPQPPPPPPLAPGAAAAEFTKASIPPRAIRLREAGLHPPPCAAFRFAPVQTFPAGVVACVAHSPAHQLALANDSFVSYGVPSRMTGAPNGRNRLCGMPLLSPQRAPPCAFSTTPSFKWPPAAKPSPSPHAADPSRPFEPPRFCWRVLKIESASRTPSARASSTPRAQKSPPSPPPPPPPPSASPAIVRFLAFISDPQLFSWGIAQAASASSTGHGPPPDFDPPRSRSSQRAFATPRPTSPSPVAALDCSRWAAAGGGCLTSQRT